MKIIKLIAIMLTAAALTAHAGVVRGKFAGTHSYAYTGGTPEGGPFYGSITIKEKDGEILQMTIVSTAIGTAVTSLVENYYFLNKSFAAKVTRTTTAIDTYYTGGNASVKVKPKGGKITITLTEPYSYAQPGFSSSGTTITKVIVDLKKKKLTFMYTDTYSDTSPYSETTFDIGRGKVKGKLDSKPKSAEKSFSRVVSKLD